MEHGNTTQPNNAQPNNQKQALTPEQKVNLKNFKRIVNREKTNLPSLRNLEWRIFKNKPNKINQVIPYILTNNITESNELIYAETKLVCEKIGICSKSTKEKSKPGGEIRLETQIKNLQKKNEYITLGNKPESTGEKRLRRYRQRVKQYW